LYGEAPLCILDFVQTAQLVYLSRLLLIVFECRPLPFLGILKRKRRPCLLPPIPFLNSPREKIRMETERQGQWAATRGTPRVGRDSFHRLESDHIAESHHARGARDITGC
jgi:hypothetical protein